MSERLLRINEVKDRTTLAQSTIYKKMAKGTFPKNVNIGKTACWLESEIDKYIQSLVEARDKDKESN